MSDDTVVNLYDGNIETLFNVFDNVNLFYQLDPQDKFMDRLNMLTNGLINMLTC